MRSAKRQPTFFEVQAVVYAKPDKVQTFMEVGKNAYVMNKGRFNGLGVIMALDLNEYEKFTMYPGAMRAN